MSKRKKRAEPFSLLRAFGADGPAQELQNVLYGKPALHIDCRGGFAIENCRGIIQYTNEQLVLDMGACLAVFRGDGLHVDTYQKDRITAHGRLFSVSFQGKEVAEL